MSFELQCHYFAAYAAFPMYNMSGRNDIFLISYYIYYLFIIFHKKINPNKPAILL